LGLSTLEDLRRNRPAGLELAPWQGHLSACAGELELQLAGLVLEHDESAVGLHQLEGRIQHSLEHLLENLGRTQDAHALQRRAERTNLAERVLPGVVLLGEEIDL